MSARIALYFSRRENYTERGWVIIDFFARILALTRNRSSICAPPRREEWNTRLDNFFTKNDAKADKKRDVSPDHKLHDGSFIGLVGSSTRPSRLIPFSHTSNEGRRRIRTESSPHKQSHPFRDSPLHPPRAVSQREREGRDVSARARAREREILCISPRPFVQAGARTPFTGLSLSR